MEALLKLLDWVDTKMKVLNEVHLGGIDDTARVLMYEHNESYSVQWNKSGESLPYQI